MKRVGIIVAAGVALGVAVLLSIIGAGETAGALFVELAGARPGRRSRLHDRPSRRRAT